MTKRKKALDKAWKAAEQEWRYFSEEELARMTESPEANTRLFALLLMRKQIEEGDRPAEYFKLARGLVPDADNNCRWQSLVVIAESIESQPDKVWEVVAEFGDSTDSDMRTAVATLLLEHLLDHDFDAYFPKVQEEVRRGHFRLIDTLETCSFDHMSGPDYMKAQRFLRRAKRGLSRADWGAS